MKTMKLWRNILVMTAAMLSFASCSSEDTTIHRGYMLKDNRQLVIFEQMYGGAPEFEEWNIKKLSSNTMTWERTDNADIIYNFKRANH